MTFSLMLRDFFSFLIMFAEIYYIYIYVQMCCEKGASRSLRSCTRVVWTLFFFFFFEIGNRNFIGNSKENYKIKGDKASPTEKRWPGLSFTPRANP